MGSVFGLPGLSCKKCIVNSKIGFFTPLVSPEVIGQRTALHLEAVTMGVSFGGSMEFFGCCGGTNSVNRRMITMV